MRLCPATLITGCSNNDEPQINPISQESLNRQLIEDISESITQFTLPDGVKHTDINTLDDLSQYVDASYPFTMVKKVIGGNPYPRFEQAWQIWLSEEDEPYYSRPLIPQNLPISANGHQITLRALYEDNYHIVEVHKTMGNTTETFYDLDPMPGMKCKETADNTFNFVFDKNTKDEVIFWIVCIQGTGTFNTLPEVCEVHQSTHYVRDYLFATFVQMPYNEVDDLHSVTLPMFLSGHEHECKNLLYSFDMDAYDEMIPWIY